MRFCSICQESELVEPVLTSCTHTYCWPHLYEAVRSSGDFKCPVCRLIVTRVSPLPGGLARSQDLDIPKCPDSAEHFPFLSLQDRVMEPSVRRSSRTRTPATFFDDLPDIAYTPQQRSRPSDQPEPNGGNTSQASRARFQPPLQAKSNKMDQVTINSLSTHGRRVVQQVADSESHRNEEEYEDSQERGSQEIIEVRKSRKRKGQELSPDLLNFGEASDSDGETDSHARLGNSSRDSGSTNGFSGRGGDSTRGLPGRGGGPTISFPGRGAGSTTGFSGRGAGSTRGSSGRGAGSTRGSSGRDTGSTRGSSGRGGGSLEEYSRGGLPGRGRNSAMGVGVGANREDFASRGTTWRGSRGGKARQRELEEPTSDEEAAGDEDEANGEEETSRQGHRHQLHRAGADDLHTAGPHGRTRGGRKGSGDIFERTQPELESANDGDEEEAYIYPDTLVPGTRKTYQEILVEGLRDYLIEEQIHHTKVTWSNVVGFIREIYPQAWAGKIPSQVGKRIKTNWTRIARQRREKKAFVKGSGISGPKLTALERAVDEILEFNSPEVGDADDEQYMNNRNTKRKMTAAEKKRAGQLLREKAMENIGPSRSRDPRIDSSLTETLASFRTDVQRGIVDHGHRNKIMMDSLEENYKQRQQDHVRTQEEKEAEKERKERSAMMTQTMQVAQMAVMSKLVSSLTGEAVPGTLGMGGAVLGNPGMGGAPPGNIGMGGAAPGSLGLGEGAPGNLGLGGAVPGTLGLGGAVPGTLGLGGAVPGTLGLGGAVTGPEGPGLHADVQIVRKKVTLHYQIEGDSDQYPLECDLTNFVDLKESLKSLLLLRKDRPFSVILDHKQVIVNIERLKHEAEYRVTEKEKENFVKVFLDEMEVHK